MRSHGARSFGKLKLMARLCRVPTWRQPGRQHLWQVHQRLGKWKRLLQLQSELQGTEGVVPSTCFIGWTGRVCNQVASYAPQLLCTTTAAVHVHWALGTLVELTGAGQQMAGLITAATCVTIQACGVGFTAQFNCSSCYCQFPGASCRPDCKMCKLLGYDGEWRVPSTLAAPAFCTRTSLAFPKPSRQLAVPWLRSRHPGRA